MHCSIVTETWPPEINGVALTVRGLARGLSELGHEVSLARPRQPADPDTPAEFEQLLVPGAGLPRYPGLRFGMPVQGRIKAFWQRRRPDAVYIATEGPLGWAALRAARRLGIPAATGFHTRFDDYIGHYGLKFLTPVVFAWLRRFHNSGQATLVPTRELRDFLASRGFDKVRLLRRSVNTRLFDPARRDEALRAEWGLAPDDLAVIYVGRIAPEKNLDLAVRSFRAIAARDPRARFVWVGDGPSRAKLAEQNADFLFAGVRRGEDLARHYASGDLFLFPSLSETFGNVTVEAMASGVATVAFGYGAAREYITDPSLGRAVPCDNASAFEAAALELAADRALRVATGRAARAALVEENVDGVASRFAGLLHDLSLEKAA